MRKSTFLFVALLAAALVPTDSPAQATQPEPGSLATQWGKPSATRSKALAELDKALTKKPRTPNLKVSRSNTKERRSLPSYAPLRSTTGSALTTADGRELWGNLVYRSDWDDQANYKGIYDFLSASPSDQKTVHTDSKLQANGKGTMFDGKLSYVYYSKTEYGLYTYFYRFDTKTWEKEKSDVIYDDGMIALETATDQATGKVYGEYYGADDASVRELAVADYTGFKPKRTTIARLTHTYVALGLSREQKLYGVATDGNLYSIDTATGEEKLVGATGVEVAYDEKGSYYIQAGEIDQTTNTFYWTAVDASKASALYTVDLTSGKATKVADFAHGEQFYDLFIPDETGGDLAPSAVASAKASFDGPSAEGTVTFTAPSKANDGSALSGDLSYYVSVGRDTLASGTTQPGAEVAAHVTAPAVGSVAFVVTTANSEGSSAKYRFTAYVGYDSPEKPTKLKFNLDTTTGKVTLSWAAPTEGQNGGFIGDLKYNVVRYPDSLTVAEGISETSFSETLSDEFAYDYYYGVTAVNGTVLGEEATTGKQLFGKSYKTPYEAKLNTNAQFRLFTVIDANKDGKKWGFYNTSARYAYGTKDADDWLVTPPLRLEKGRVYKISVKAGGHAVKNPERIEVKAGRGNTAEDMTMSVVEAQDVVTGRSQFVTLTGELRATETGDYYLGFHALSTAKDGYYLYLKDINVDGGTSEEIPGTVTDLKVVPDATGLLRANVSFKAPSVNSVGGRLGSLSKITVKRNGREIKTFGSDVKPGQALSFDDETDRNGVNTYVVRAFGEAGQGDSASVEAYIGVDVPRRPRNVQLADNQTSLHMTWDQVSSEGLNNGIVRPQDVWYYIYDITLSGELVMRDSTQNLYYDFPMNTGEGKQDLIQYALAAKNAADTSYVSYSPGVVVGKPFALPFHDSFAGGQLAYDLWWLGQNGTAVFEMYKNFSYDNDGGSFVYRSYLAGDEGSLNTGKISLAGAVNPRLSFYHYATPGDDAKLYVDVFKADGTTDSLLVYDIASDREDPAWRKAVVDLKSYKAEKFVILKFRVAARRAGNPIYVDNVTVRDVLEDDLSATVAAPESVDRGSKFKVRVSVDNIGMNAASDYSVGLFLNDKEVATQHASKELAPDSVSVYEFEYQTSVFDNFSKANLKAVVDYALDLDETNNTDSAAVDLLSKEYAAPTGVKAAEGKSSAEVSWNAPSVFSRSFTDSYEDYARGDTTAIGNWITIDRDHGQSGAVLMFSTGYTALHYLKPYAFTVFNPEKTLNGLTAEYPVYTPHTGEQYLANVYAGDPGTQTTFDADNWLISPVLSGEKQTVRLYAKNHPTANSEYPETFDVLYSTGSTSPDDFVKVGQTHTVTGGEWTRIEAELPEGATRFAVHHNTEAKNNFFFALDDATYRVRTDAPTGFNIYRDSEKIAFVEYGKTSFADTDVPDGEHVYSVSAVYADGESAAVSAEAVVITGIEGVVTDAPASFDVYTTDGKLVGRNIKSLDMMKRGVYVVNGRKVVVK